MTTANGMTDILERGGVTRRGVLTGASALVVSFLLLSRSLAQEAAQPPAPEPPKLPGSLDETASSMHGYA